MSDNQKKHPEKWENEKREKWWEHPEHNDVYFYIEQLRSLFANNHQIVMQLDTILKKLQEVSKWIQFMISGMLKELSSEQSVSVKATIGALNTPPSSPPKVPADPDRSDISA